MERNDCQDTIERYIRAIGAMSSTNLGESAPESVYRNHG